MGKVVWVEKVDTYYDVEYRFYRRKKDRYGDERWFYSACAPDFEKFTGLKLDEGVLTKVRISAVKV